MSKHELPITHHQPDLSLLSELTWKDVHLPHRELAAYLTDKNPYTVTVILDSLDEKYFNRKTHVEKTKYPRMSKYRELLHKALNKEFGEIAANEQYRQWLEKYRQKWLDEGKSRDLDDYILELEMEPQYQKAIEKRYKNLEKLRQPRSYTRRERYYTLPKPITHVDWRSPYDNLFIWTEGNQKYVARGGSGSSGTREMNSRYIFALGLLNQKYSVPSHLFLYDKTNQLHQLYSFPTLTVPNRWNIGANYHLKPAEEKMLLKKVNFLSWKDVSELQELFIELD